MKNRIVTIVGSLLALAAFAGPAMAIGTLPEQLPEPATLTLFGLGVAGAYIAKKFTGRN